MPGPHNRRSLPLQAVLGDLEIDSPKSLIVRVFSEAAEGMQPQLPRHPEPGSPARRTHVPEAPGPGRGKEARDLG